jgi:release factor glutamine methyltransferase
LNLPPTISEALDMGRRALASISETPSLDTQLLLSEVLNRSRAWILAHSDVALKTTQAQAFIKLLSRCESGEALPHVIGWWEFYGRRILLTPDVLIPRPETEMMVETGLQYLADRPMFRKAADIGTGSGCVAVTLAAEVSDLNVIATDLDAKALQVARSNANAFNVASRIRFLQADLLLPLNTSFDLICANLPYIPTRMLPGLEVAKREPLVALDGCTDGLLIIRRLLNILPRWLEVEGRALLEIGDGQADLVLNVAREIIPTSETRVRKDLAGKDRMLVIDRRK